MSVVAIEQSGDLDRYAFDTIEAQCPFEQFRRVVADVIDPAAADDEEMLTRRTGELLQHGRCRQRSHGVSGPLIFSDRDRLCCCSLLSCRVFSSLMALNQLRNAAIWRRVRCSGLRSEPRISAGIRLS